MTTEKFRIAIYPGTFDPVTNGHLDIIKRSLRLFDKIVIGVTTNPAKKPFFSLFERLQLLRACLKGTKNLEIKSFDDMLVDFAKREKASAIIRGLRQVSDFEEEFQRVHITRGMAPEVETIFIMTSENFFYLTSSIVKELAQFSGPLKDFVPKPVEQALRKKFKQTK